MNFVAGTNFVQTVAASDDPTCAAGCVQVLFVGEGTVPNNPSTVTFCNTVLSLAGVGAELQALIGNVDPTSHDDDHQHPAERAGDDGLRQQHDGDPQRR